MTIKRIKKLVRLSSTHCAELPYVVVSADDQSPEACDALENMLMMAENNGRAALESIISAMAPDAERGGKFRRGARNGHESVHGNKDEKEARWKKYQDRVDELHAKNPNLSHSAIAQKLANEFEVSQKTLLRHTTIKK